jgi:signal transduction histidine kinase
MKFFLSWFFIFFPSAFIINNLLAQTPRQDSLLILIEKEKYDEVEKILSKTDTLKLSETQKADYYFAKAQVLDVKGVHDISFKYYLNARKKYLVAGEMEKAMLVTYQLAFAVVGDDPNIYLQEMESYLKKHDNNKIASRFYYLKAYEKIIFQENDKALELCNLAHKAIVATTDSLYMYKVNSFIGLIYSQILNNPLKGLEHEMKLYPYLERNKVTDQIANSKVNQAAVYYTLKEHRKAINLLKEALEIDITVFEKGMKVLIYEALSLNYENLKDYENAIKYIHLSKEYADSLNFKKQDIAIREYQIQYETEKKQLENEYLKQENVLLGEKQRANRILFFVTLGLFIALLTASYFIVKYLLRKKKIAEQEKIIEQQKSENLLKTQEMNIIDAMIEGQEKERQLIAQDLHDNLGSMLASLRLNFENLRSQTAQENNPLFEKADGLINDAYQNVRRLAHAKNSGVIADRGLIPALKILAEKTSVPKKFEIEIQSFGMNSRLDLSLEITVFRAIQELVTNCIKHASASKVLISLTQHQNEINIIVEDNGKGFAKNITEGMGLSNIRKKIKSYGGTFDIDSSSRGTTIIINIPI